MKKFMVQSISNPQSTMPVGHTMDGAAPAQSEARTEEILRVMTACCETLAARAEGIRRELGEARWQNAQRFEELALLTQMLEQSRAEADELARELHILRSSTSWRMTRPIRRLSQIMSGRSKRVGGGETS